MCCWKAGKTGLPRVGPTCALLRWVQPACQSAHLAPRRADYEQAFAGVNLKTDIISGALFNISGTLFQGARNHKNLRSSFSSVWPNLLAPLYLTPPGDPSNTVHSFQSTFSTKVLHPSEMAIFILLSTVLFQVCPQVACRGKE